MSGWRARVAAPAELPALLALRHEVFVRGQGVSPALEQDGLDPAAVHVGVWSSGASNGAGPVGTGRFVGAPPGPARVGRMAVDERVRGRGAGSAVLRGLERAAVERGHSGVVLHAQSHARDFYARLGYTPVGDEFTEAGIPHLEMARPLPVIGPVAATDSAELIELIGACWGEYPGAVLDVDAEEPWLREPAGYYARTGGLMWVARLGGTGPVVACVGIRSSAEVPETGFGPADMELKSLYVAAAVRRRGLAEILVDRVEEEARRRGATRMVLWSDSRFHDAHRLYIRLGYHQVPGDRELHDLSNTIEHPFAKPLT